MDCQVDTSGPKTEIIALVSAKLRSKSLTFPAEIRYRGVDRCACSRSSSLWPAKNRAQGQEDRMFYTSMSLWFRAESLVEAGFIAAATVLAIAYGIALWRAARVAGSPAITPQ
jgi:hypothetical protein